MCIIMKSAEGEVGGLMTQPWQHWKLSIMSHVRLDILDLCVSAANL